MSGVQSEDFSGPVDDRADDLSAVSPVGATDAVLRARINELEDEVAHLEAALETRTRIGTAIGLLAERHDTTTDRAWALLTRLSNHTNHKVQEVARLLVAVTDGTLDTHEVEAVGALARHLPRAVAAVGLDAGRSPGRRRPSGPSAPGTPGVRGVPERRGRTLPEQVDQPAAPVEAVPDVPDLDDPDGAA